MPAALRANRMAIPNAFFFISVAGAVYIIFPENCEPDSVSFGDVT